MLFSSCKTKNNTPANQTEHDNLDLFNKKGGLCRPSCSLTLTYQLSLSFPDNHFGVFLDDTSITAAKDITLYMGIT